MSGALLWLGLYLAAGLALLWVCYNTGACLVQARLERNARILSALGASRVEVDRPAPLPVAAPR